jgi:hypothetical protein
VVKRRFKVLIAVGAVAAAVAAVQVGVQAGAASTHIRHLSGPVYARSASPHSAPMAQHLDGAVVQNGSGPHKVPEPNNIDGCDHDYGAVGQCVPWTVPGTTTQQRCAWLSAHGFGPLAITGEDRQHLDPVHAGTACAAADLS